MVVQDKYLARVKAVQDKYTQYLMEKPHVVGVGIGHLGSNGFRAGLLGLIVLVDQEIPDDQLDPEDRVPDEIEGIPVELQEVGRIEAQ
jgi:hypothetical protein